MQQKVNIDPMIFIKGTIVSIGYQYAQINQILQNFEIKKGSNTALS